MKTVGVICEYNPFHRGHAHQLERARRESGADYVICLMGGCFTQRGDAALLDPWIRAEMALWGGADVVLELPVLWAMRAAASFALGGVWILHQLGVHALSFGCEVEALPLLESNMTDPVESASFQSALHRRLGEGYAFPKAQALAHRDTKGDAAPHLPNLTLGIEYRRAIRQVAPAMEVFPIPRVGPGHHSEALETYASATALRRVVEEGTPDLAAPAMTPEAFALLQSALAQGAQHPRAALDQAKLYALRTGDPARLGGLLDMREGLEYLFYQEAQYATDAQSLLRRVKSKRYTHARLNRLLSCALLNIPQDLADAVPLPPYVRLLGMRREAGPLVRAFQEGDFPLLTRGADPRFRRHPLLELEARAYDVWALGAANPDRRGGGRFFSRPPVIV